MSSQIWLEPTHLHFHTGHEAQVKLYRGEQMFPQPPTGGENISVKLICPNGSIENLSIADTKNDDYFLITFSPADEGLYTLTARSDGDKYAKIVVPVGHHLHGTGKPTGEELEIVSETVQEFRLQDPIVLTVFNRGKPLSGVEIKATYHLYDGGNYPYNLTTNGKGQAEFVFPEKGHWMFMVDNGGKTATLVVPGVR
ncbi:DUF4198 domain-containing protein [Desulfolucanica intricata]|uniref:DUF4198 domain-containing protein n=1 Tax=Desulfolucanica intricata TaxID=1285191 RepID=UPI00082CCBC3|nr:DUF4198 domain-containing protein [Desulfolucanica intricata]